MQTITTRTAPIGALALLGALLGGCAWHEPSRVEEDFGKSVRQMVQEQIHDTQAASRPPLNAPDLLDGTTSDITVETYRQATREARVFREPSPGNPVPVVSRSKPVGSGSESSE